jgi:hypothetical protein
MKKIVFFLVLSLVFVFCKKETSTDVLMTYQMTQCADPWQQEADYLNNKEATLKKYLEKQGVSVVKLSIVVDCTKSAVCAACTCQGCDFASVKVSAADVTAMEKLKFVKK